MSNYLPYGGERNSHGDVLSLKQKALDQDTARSILKDEQYANITGVNRPFTDIPPEIVIPCDGSRLDNSSPGPQTVKDISPKAYAEYLRRGERMDREDYFRLLRQKDEEFTNSIDQLSFD